MLYKKNFYLKILFLFQKDEREINFCKMSLIKIIIEIKNFLKVFIIIQIYFFDGIDKVGRGFHLIKKFILTKFNNNWSLRILVLLST
jgi:hypothetical protein